MMGDIDAAADTVEPLYAQIGQVASAWSHLEQSVDVTIWRLACIDHGAGACITAQIQSLTYRLFALAALAERKFGAGKIVDAINRFSALTVPISKKRNRVIHTPIALDDGSVPIAVVIRAERKLTYEFVKVEVTKYHIIADEIHDLLCKYSNLDQMILEEEVALRERIFAMRPAVPADHLREAPDNV